LFIGCLHVGVSADQRVLICPSSMRARAIFSEVASAWRSTRIIQHPCAAFTSLSASRKGFSRSAMKVRPCKLITAIGGDHRPQKYGSPGRECLADN
jgi:hypothetical protein